MWPSRTSRRGIRGFPRAVCKCAQSGLLGVRAGSFPAGLAVERRLAEG